MGKNMSLSKAEASNPRRPNSNSNASRSDLVLLYSSVSSCIRRFEFCSCESALPRLNECFRRRLPFSTPACEITGEAGDRISGRELPGFTFMGCF